MTLAYLLVLSLFVGCTTTTTTHPDGSRTTVSMQDPKVVKAITEAVAQAAATAAVQALEDAAAKQNGQP